MAFDGRAWIEQKIKEGRAIVRPAGYHIVAEPLQGFASRLNACRDLGELEGFANRRRLNPELPKWSASERDAILRRKFEMENEK
jgi:hypothetical protein